MAASTASVWTADSAVCSRERSFKPGQHAWLVGAFCCQAVQKLLDCQLCKDAAPVCICKWVSW